MKKLTLSDYQALAESRYQIRRFLHFSEQVVKTAGLERGQYQLMLAIKGMPAGVRPRIRELANRMQIRHHSAGELALHHHDELRSSGPELVTALRRIMREGDEAAPSHSFPTKKGKSIKHP